MADEKTDEKVKQVLEVLNGMKYLDARKVLNIAVEKIKDNSLLSVLDNRLVEEGVS